MAGVKAYRAGTRLAYRLASRQKPIHIRLATIVGLS